MGANRREPRRDHIDGPSQGQTLDLHIADQVATITLLNEVQRRERIAGGGQADVHWELGTTLNRLREDDRVRVVVITGAEDGQFWAPRMPGTEYEPLLSGPPPPVAVPDRHWRAFMGVRMVINAITEMEKPVIACVNGDAVGFGQSIMFACDLIVARDDAMVCDNHMGLEGADPYGLPFSAVPGDGGAALVPLHLPPAKAMEYLLLATVLTTEDLARLGAINCAVPPDHLDDVTEDLVQRLLQRSAYSLALTKRVVKRRVADHVNLTLDASGGYEWVAFLHYQATGHSTRSLEV